MHAQVCLEVCLKVQKTKHKLKNIFSFEALIIKPNQLATLVLSAEKEQ